MQLLTPEQIERVNEHSLRLLEQVGLRIDHDLVRAKLLAAGCRELPTGTVAFPRELVAECLQLAPERVRLGAHAGEPVEVYAGGPTIFWTGNALHIAEGQHAHPIGEEDFIRLTRVADALEHVHAPVGPANHDLPAQHRDFVACRIMAQHSGKHLRPCMYTARGCRACCEMGEVLASPHSLREMPVVSFGYTAVSPLRWTEPGLEMWLQTSGYGAPMMINSEPAAGATGPVTLAGMLMLANAEALSGLVILQTLEPGRPCIFNMGFAHTMDMREAITRTGGPENGILQAAGAQFAAYHGLPSASWMNTESMADDEQAAFEKTNTALMHALAGVNVVWGIGNLESTRAMSLAQMVIDNDIAGVCLRSARPVDTDDEALAYELVAELGTRADYLWHEHTMRHFREELHIPELAFVGRRERWEREGARRMVERARDRVADILAAEPRHYLSEDKERELLAIEERWRKELS